MLGQLPLGQVSPGLVFEQTGVDYAGPVFIKLGAVRKPLVTKVYISVFVSFAVKAVHLELHVVNELTTAAFIAVLCGYIAR